MSGELNLEKLLAGMSPVLDEREMFYCSLPGEAPSELVRVALGTFRESEGTTLILPRADAEAMAVPFSYPCRMITLQVHSALSAVGFLARVLAELAGRGISTNTISAYYHDHLLVPADRAQEALAILRALQDDPAGVRR